ncbi:MAG: Hsp20/alpha crystallin family protein [Bacteroidota bacterium]
MTLVKYHYNNPVDQFLNEFFNTEEEDANQGQCRMPNANVIEAADKYMVQIALPGFEKKQISMNVENDELVVSAEKEDDNKNYHLREFGAPRMERRFDLSEAIDEEKISASFKNGILNIELPLKKEVTKKKEIAIV